MGNQDSPVNGRFRAFIVVVVATLFLVCLSAIVWVLLETREVLLAAPLTLLALGHGRLLRWSMIWFSTPNERELLGRSLEAEPWRSIVRDLINRLGSGPSPPAT